MIEIYDLHKSFGTNEILKGISLTIPTGSIYGIVGSSGAGKSTLLRCINALEPFDSGMLLVNETNVKNLSETEGRLFRKNIGMVFQNFSLLNRMTTYENIALPMKCWGAKKLEIDRRVKELLNLVQIPEKINSRPFELSGGQKQRVAIARALAMKPQILLCDEATSALDPRVGHSILSLLNDINKELGITIVVVTHQMSIVQTFCSHVAVMETGKIADFGTVDSVFFKQSQSLKNIIGNESYCIPSDGKNIKIFLEKNPMNNMIITELARKLQIDFLVLEGGIEKYQTKQIGHYTINIKDKDINQVERYLTQKKIPFHKL